MAKLNEKQKLLAIGGGAVAICLLAGGGVYWAQGLIDEVQQSIEKKEAEIAAADLKINKVPATEKEVIILRENLDVYVKILPETQSLNDFVTTLTQFAATSGVMTQNVAPAKISKAAGKTPERFSRIEYSYEVTGTLWQFVKFMNLIENYERFISITDFSIAQINGRDAEQRDGWQVHTIKLSMETYVYNAKGTGLEVEIPDYNDKKDLLREEIAKRSTPFSYEKYDHKGPRGRRDIFVDPRNREGRADGPSVEEQKKILDGFIGDLQKVKDLMQKRKRPEITVFDIYMIDKQIAESLDKIEIAAQEVTAKQQISAPNLRVQWVKSVVEPLADLRVAGNAKDPRKGSEQFVSKEELESLIKGMQDMMEQGDLEGADNRFDAFAKRILVPENDPLHELAVAAKALQLKVKTAMEFKNLELKIQGVLVNHDGGRSGLLVNGDVFEEGEYISDELMLRRVEEEQVWFVFRGLTLIRTL